MICAGFITTCGTHYLSDSTKDDTASDYRTVESPPSTNTPVYPILRRENPGIIPFPFPFHLFSLITMSAYDTHLSHKVAVETALFLLSLPYFAARSTCATTVRPRFLTGFRRSEPSCTHHRCTRYLHRRRRHKSP